MKIKKERSETIKLFMSIPKSTVSFIYENLSGKNNNQQDEFNGVDDEQEWREQQQQMLQSLDFSPGGKQYLFLATDILLFRSSYHKKNNYSLLCLPCCYVLICRWYFCYWHDLCARG